MKNYFTHLFRSSSTPTVYAYVITLATILSTLIYHFANDVWLYPIPQIPDTMTGNAFSYYYDLKFYKHQWYKASRIPWNIPLFYLQKIVGPYQLIPVLTSLAWVILGLAYFLTIKSFAGLRRAVIFLPWIVFFPMLVSYHSGGGSYHNYGSTIYFLLSLYTWHEGLKREQSFLMILSGFFLGCTLKISLVHLNLLPMYPVIEVFRSKKINSRRYLLLAGGIGISFLFWGFLNVLHNRRFFPYASILETLFQHLALKPEYKALNKSLKTLFFLQYGPNYYFIFLTAFLLILPVRLISFIKRRAPIEESIFTILSLSLCALWIIWNEVGMQSLYPMDFIYPLQVPFFITIALYLRDKPLSRRDLCYTICCLSFLFLALLYAQALRGVENGFAWKFVGQHFIASVALVAVTAGLLLTKGLPKLLKPLLSIILAIFYSALSDEHRDPDMVFCNFRKSSHNATIDIVERMRKHESSPQKAFLYYIPNEKIPYDGKVCSWIKSLETFHTALNASNIHGTSFTFHTYEIVPPGEVTRESFERVRQDQGILTVQSVYPETFSLLENRAVELGYLLQGIDTFETKVMNQIIPLKIYRVSTALPALERQVRNTTEKVFHIDNAKRTLDSL